MFDWDLYVGTKKKHLFLEPFFFLPGPIQGGHFFWGMVCFTVLDTTPPSQGGLSVTVVVGELCASGKKFPTLAAIGLGAVILWMRTPAPNTR